MARIADIAWIDATELILLGAPTFNDNLELIRIRDDGSRITSTTGEPSDWDARDITVQMRTKTTIVRGPRGDTWRNNGSQWVLFLDGHQRHRVPRLTPLLSPPPREFPCAQ